MNMKSSLLGGVATGVLIALVTVNGASAKTSKPSVAQQQQQEIDELKQQLQFLKERLDEQAAVNMQAKAQVAAAQADAEAAKAQAAAATQTAQADAMAIKTLPDTVKVAVAANAPKTDKAYYKGISITMGGFAEAATIYRDHDETADISSSFSKIPFANDRASHTGETRFTARQSRYSILAAGDVNKDVDGAFYGEFDFQAAAQTANSNQSNSYSPRIRNLYGEVNWKDEGWHFLAGQNWSLLTTSSKGITPRNEVTPPQIDAQYIPGFAWARQPQVRLVKDFNKELWIGVSVEQAQTTFGNTAVASGVTLTNSQAPTNGFYNATNYSLNTVPDVIGKVAWEHKFADHTLHIEGFGLFRQYTDRITIAPAAGTQALALGYAATAGQTLNNTGGGGGGSITFDLVPKRLDLTASGMAGNGIGRYGSAGLPDTTAAPNGKLYGIPETMFLAGGTFHASPAWDVYLFGGGEFENSKTFASNTAPVAFGYGTLPGSTNAGCIVEGGTCSAVTKSIDQVTVGFWDKFYQGKFGRFQFGVQYSYTEKKAFADALGFAPSAKENMIFTSFRYYPF
jgi:hypothetical protein